MSIVAQLSRKEVTNGEAGPRAAEQESTLRDFLLPDRRRRDREEPGRQPPGAAASGPLPAGAGPGPHPAAGQRRFLGHPVHRLLLPADLHLPPGGPPLRPGVPGRRAAGAGAGQDRGHPGLLLREHGGHGERGARLPRAGHPDHRHLPHAPGQAHGAGRPPAHLRVRVPVHLGHGQPAVAAGRVRGPERGDMPRPSRMQEELRRLPDKLPRRAWPRARRWPGRPSSGSRTRSSSTCWATGRCGPWPTSSATPTSWSTPRSTPPACGAASGGTARWRCCRAPRP